MPGLLRFFPHPRRQAEVGPTPTLGSLDPLLFGNGKARLAGSGIIPDAAIERMVPTGGAALLWCGDPGRAVSGR